MLERRGWAEMQPEIIPLPVQRQAPNGPRWHVVRTNIKCEWRAKMGIGALGFPIFLPTERRRAIRRRRRTVIESPLFGRYLFVEFDARADEWSAIRLVDGVEAILCNNDVPVPVPAFVIDALMLGVRLGMFDKTKSPGDLVIGQSAEVTEGPYMNLIAEITRARKDDRVDTVINYLGKSWKATIPLAHLRAVG